MVYKIAILALLALQALTTSALASQHPCICTRENDPVCGSDGKTYNNKCMLECENYKTGRNIMVAKYGPCGIQCDCPYTYNPVCGNDGKTYPNRCSLLCERSNNPNVDVVSEGVCNNPATKGEPNCFCPYNLDYVCGSDGNTYENPCVLNCETAKNPSLSIEHRGKCDDSVQVVDPFPLPKCVCTREMREVCGSDGVTYHNPCMLNCATAHNPSLTIAHEGKCSPPTPACVCTFELNLVCGSDGITYSNPCSLNCATANNPSLHIVNQGSCIPDQPSCICTAEVREVCGTDGVTYINSCQLNCATIYNPMLSITRQGKC